MQKTDKKIILAIGNPGTEYESTYHNAGILALKTAAPDVAWKSHKKLFEYAEEKTAPGTVFARSLTFMNESGKAAREALKKFGAQPKELVVLQDDSDITIGEFKISIARTSAGHKGIQSIIDILGTNAFTRVRIGIRPAQETKRKKAGEFALKKISSENKKLLAGVFAKITEYIGTSS